MMKHRGLQYRSIQWIKRVQIADETETSDGFDFDSLGKAAVSDMYVMQMLRTPMEVVRWVYIYFKSYLPIQNC